MRIKLSVILSLFLTGSCVFCGAVSAEPVETSAPVGDDLPKLWFHVGEKITYKIYWGIISVGESVLKTKWIEEDGRKLIHIQLRSKDNKFLSKIYPVDDIIESVIDPETFLPLRFTKQLNEGNYHCDETTTYDYQKLEAHWKSALNDNEKTYKIDKDTRDILSFMYHMRKNEIKVNSTNTYRVATDEKVFDVEVEALKEEKVKAREYGKIKCLKIEPKGEFDGVAVHKGRSWMWIARDPRRLCVQVAAEVPVAKVKLRLFKVEGPGDDFWVKKKSAYDSEKNTFYK